jgi:hypothetical protein
VSTDRLVAVRRSAMTRSFSWDLSAVCYGTLYRKTASTWGLPPSLCRFPARAHEIRRLLLHRSHRRLHEFRLQPDAFDRRFRLRELAGVIAKRRDVSLGGVECFSRKLEPSNQRTIELADIVMRKIAQLGKLRTGFWETLVASLMIRPADARRR